jgi:uncharacterized metal-binding protein
MSTKAPILVIPCSGIGKAYGAVSRDAALQVVEDLRPHVSETICLSLLVMGDEEARARLQRTRAVTIDGCALACARKNAELAGGVIGESIMVLDVYRQHKELKTQAVTFLDENGHALSAHVAAAAVQAVDTLRTEQEDGHA